MELNSTSLKHEWSTGTLQEESMKTTLQGDGIVGDHISGTQHIPGEGDPNVSHLNNLKEEHVLVTSIKDSSHEEMVEGDFQHSLGEPADRVSPQNQSETIQYVQGGDNSQYNTNMEVSHQGATQVEYRQIIQGGSEQYIQTIPVQGTEQYGESLPTTSLEVAYEQTITGQVKGNLHYGQAIQDTSNNQVTEYVETVETVEGGNVQYDQTIQHVQEVCTPSTSDVNYEQVIQPSSQENSSYTGRHAVQDAGGIKMEYEQTLYDTGDSENKNIGQLLHGANQGEYSQSVNQLQHVQASGTLDQFGNVVADQQDMQTLQNIQIAQILQSMRGIEQAQGSQELSGIGHVEEVQTNSSPSGHQVIAIIPDGSNHHRMEQIPEVGNMETVRVVDSDDQMQEIRIIREGLPRSAGNNVYNIQTGANPAVSGQSVASMWAVDLQHLIPASSQYGQSPQVQFNSVSGPNVQVEPVQVMPQPTSQSIDSQPNLQPLMTPQLATVPASSEESNNGHIPVVVMNRDTPSNPVSISQGLLLPEIESVEVVTSTVDSKPGTSRSTKRVQNEKKGPFFSRRISSIEKPYGCGVCQLAFAVPLEVKMHLQTHSTEEIAQINDKIFKCPVCALAFSRSDNLKRHTRFHADDNKELAEITPKPFTCPICHQGFSRADTHKRHVKAHTQPYEPQRRVTLKNHKNNCATCGEFFSDKTAKLHHNGAKNAQVALLNCDECGDIFCRKTSLEKHLGKKHQDKNAVVPGTVVYSCPVCSLLFSSVASLVRHERIHKNKEEYRYVGTIKRNKKDKKAMNDQVKKKKKKKKNKVRAVRKVVIPSTAEGTGNTMKNAIISKPLEKPYGCTQCEESFASPIELKKHAGSVSHAKDLYEQNKEPCRCPVCGQIYNRMDNLKRHTRIHTGEMPHKCSECDFGCQRLSTLRDHQLAHVTGTEFPYACAQCNKAFSRKHSLKTHMFLHLGLRPFVCTDCKKTFTRKFLLKEHMKIHTGERPFECQECGIRFRQRSTMVDHRKTHYKDFANRGRRKKERICPECGVTLFTWYGFKAHIGVHKGLNKDNFCLVCKKVFSTPYNVKHHMAKVHKLDRAEINDMFVQKEEANGEKKTSIIDDYEQDSAMNKQDDVSPGAHPDDKENVRHTGEQNVTENMEEEEFKEEIITERLVHESEDVNEVDHVSETIWKSGDVEMTVTGKDDQHGDTDMKPEVQEYWNLATNAEREKSNDENAKQQTETLAAGEISADQGGFFDSQLAYVDHNYGDGRRPHSDHKYD